jgi:hypothetical protein
MEQQQHIAMDSVPELFANVVLSFMRGDHRAVEQLAQQMGQSEVA